MLSSSPGARKPVSVESISDKALKCVRSAVEIGQIAFLFKPGAPLRGLAPAHEHVEQLNGLLETQRPVGHRQQTPAVRVHGGVPPLLGAHFAQTLEPAEGSTARADA